MGLSALLLMFPEIHISSVPTLEVDEDLLLAEFLLSSWRE